VKILVVATPGAGRINPMLPLLEELVAQGDEVTVAVGDDASSGAVSRKSRERWLGRCAIASALSDHRVFAFGATRWSHEYWRPAEPGHPSR
jgi:hypothetical protein